MLFSTNNASRKRLGFVIFPRVRPLLGFSELPLGTKFGIMGAGKKKEKVPLMTQAFTRGQTWKKVCVCGCVLCVVVACGECSVRCPIPLHICCVGLQDDLLDVLYWIRQVLGLVLGLLWGVIPLYGFIGILSYVTRHCPFAVVLILVWLFFIIGMPS